MATVNKNFRVRNGLDALGDISTTGILKSTQSSGDEGGQIDLTKSVTNTTLTTGVSIDVYQNRLRFFETGGTNRGFYIDISTGGATAGTNLVGGGGSFTGGTLTSDLVLAAGSASVEPLTFQANSATPTVTAGAWDYDGDKFSAVTSGTATGRLMVPVTAWAFSNANATQATGTTAQSIFPVGARTLPLEANKTYYFKLVLAWTHAWSAGGPNTGRIEPTFVNAPQEINYVIATVTSGGGALSNRATATGATNYTPATSSNGLTGTTTVEGFFRSNATTGGTVEFKYSTNSGGTGGFTMLAGCFERVIKLGSGANSPLAISGTWS